MASANWVLLVIPAPSRLGGSWRMPMRTTPPGAAAAVPAGSAVCAGVDVGAGVLLAEDGPELHDTSTRVATPRAARRTPAVRRWRRAALSGPCTRSGRLPGDRSSS